MKFSFSPRVLLTVLFTSSFAAPTERALSKRLSFRDVEATVDEHRLSKHSVCPGFTLSSIVNTGIWLKRDTEEVDGELSKRSKEYSPVVTSLSSGSGLGGRSTDAYEGRHVVVSMSDAMVQGLQEIGVSQDQMPKYVSQTMHVTDPDTG